MKKILTTYKLLSENQQDIWAPAQLEFRLSIIKSALNKK